MRNAAIIILLAVFALLYFLIFSRFDILAGDEGYFNLVCYRIINGQMPYRDFFLHTPPLSYWVQTAVFKKFELDLIVGRITTVFAGVIMVVLIFLISRRFAPAPFSIIPSLIFIFWGTCHIPYPSFNWYATLVALAIIPFVFKFTDSSNRAYLVPAAILTAVLCLTKQNLGVAAIISISLYLWLFRYARPGGEGRAVVMKNVFLDYLVMALTGMLTILPAAWYFHSKKILKDAIYYLFNFSYGSLKARMEISSFPHLKPASLLILGAYILTGYALYEAAVKKRFRILIAVILILPLSFAAFYRFADARTQFYVNDHIKEGFLNGFFNLPGLLIIMTAFLWIFRRARRVAIENEDLRLSFMGIFSFFYIWFGLTIARDMIHLLPTMPIAYGLFGYYFFKMYGFYKKRLAVNMVMTVYCFVFPVVFLCLLGLYTNINNETFRDPGLNTGLNAMRSPLKIDRAKFLLVEEGKADETEKLVKYITNNTEKGERIFLFKRIDSSIYILADRMPATFNTLFIPDAFRGHDEERVLSDLERNKVRFAVCDKETYELWDKDKRLADHNRTALLEDYLHRNYAVRKMIGQYYILIKK